MYQCFKNIVILCKYHVYIKEVILSARWNTYRYNNYIPRRKSGIYWIQVRRAAAAAAAAVEISLWTR